MLRLSICRLVQIFLIPAILVASHVNAGTYEDQVQKMYVAYYGRPGDPAGLNWWAGKLDAANGNLSEIINSFGNSQEYVERLGSMSNAALINNIFIQLLGRDADDAGRDWYVGQLESGDPSWSLASIALRIADGVHDGTGDALVVANRMAVANAFTKAVNDEIISYVGSDEVDAAVSLLVNVTSDEGSVSIGLSALSDTDGDGVGNFSDNDDDNDSVLDIHDTFPYDVDQFKTTSEQVCPGPEWEGSLPGECFIVDTTLLGGLNQSAYKVNNPGVLSTNISTRREKLASLPADDVNQFCSDIAASASRVPAIAADSVAVHLTSWEGESIDVDSHIEAAYVTLKNLSVEGGLDLEEFSFQFSIADEAQTVDFYFDPGFNPSSVLDGFSDPFYFLVTLDPKRVAFSNSDRYRLNKLPANTRNVLLSTMKNARELIGTDAEITRESGASIYLLDTHSEISSVASLFSEEVFSLPELPPLDEIWCSDDFAVCNEYLPNWEFRDTLVNVTADYLAYGDVEVGDYLLNKLKVWAESGAFLNVRNVTLGESGQDDFWPRYEINMVMISILETWSLLRQDNVPSQSEIDLIDSWIGKVLSFTALTTTSGPGGDKGHFNVSYLVAGVQMAWGALQGNDTIFTEGLEKIVLALHQMNDDGGFPREIARGGNAYLYQNLTTMSVMYMANLARVQGYDVFSWNVEGKSLHDMVSFAIDSAKSPATLETYATEHNYPWHPLPINFESTLKLDSTGRESKYSRGKMHGAWFEVYMALFPSENWKSEVDALLFLGLEESRPVHHELMGTNTTCYFSAE